jgi:acetyl-CoA carboxylase biotin carboxyl carrier protein
MPLTDDDVREILRLIDESDVEELRVETAAFSLHVLRGDGVAAREADSVSDTDLRSSRMVEPKNSAVSDTGADLITVAAPMLGTFYRAEAPGAAPYVEVGDRVEPESVVCLIEVMKMMNAVTAGVSGTVVEVCAENAQLVEYGDPLFRIEAES